MVATLAKNINITDSCATIENASCLAIKDFVIQRVNIIRKFQ